MRRGNVWSRHGVVLGALSVFTALSACGESEDSDDGDGKKGGAGGTAGASGAAGNSAGVMNGGRAGSASGGTSGAGRGGTGMGGVAGTSAGDGGAGDGGAGDGGAGDGGDGGAAGSAMGGAGMGGAGMGGAGRAGGGMGGAGIGGAGMGGAGAGGAGMAGTGGVGPPAINLYFSEYYEGSVTPQESAVEIVNAGMAAVDLTQCSVRVYPNGNGNFTSILLITTLAPGQVYVVCSAAGVSGNCDLSNSTMGQVTGNDVVAVVCNGQFQDIIGQIGNDPASGEWGTGATSTADNTIRRSCAVTTGDKNGNDTFTVPSTQWTGLAATKTDLGTRICIN